RARAHGTADLTARSADLAFAVDASAMAPRPDLAWRRIAATGRWHGGLKDATATGTLEVEDLRLGRAATIGALRATLAGARGRLTLRGSLANLRIGGQQPDLLAKAPIAFDAQLLPGPARQRLRVQLTQPLFSIGARIGVARPLRVDLSGEVPQIAPFAALAGQSLSGRAAIQLRLRSGATGIGVALSAQATALASKTRWLAALGDRAQARIDGVYGDPNVVVSRLRIAGRDWTLHATGGAVQRAAGGAVRAMPTGLAAWLESLHAQWRLDGPALGDFAPALAGRLSGSGEISGTLPRLVLEARFASRFTARGSIPGALNASIRAGLAPGAGGELRLAGRFDAAPLGAVLTWQRGADGAVHADVRGGKWKSARLDAQFALDRGLSLTQGSVHLDVANLGDFADFTGVDFGGALAADGRVRSVAGHRLVQLGASFKAVRVGRLEGDARISASGPLNALDVSIDARLPQLGGASLHWVSSGTWNPAARALRIASASIEYRGQSGRLRGPARLSYADGLSIDAFDLDLGSANFRLSGRIAPTLAVQTSLIGATPKLVDLIVPGFLAGGRIEAHAELRGRLAAPTGEVRWDARGIRAADAQAFGLPAVNFSGTAHLDGESASVEGRVTAGKKAALTLSGRVPLRADGPLHVAVAGTMDLGLAAPTLEARGIFIAGSMQVAASVSGTLRAPLLAGLVRVSGGHLRDYVRGLNLENVNAQFAGDGDALSIEKFTGSIPPGTVSMTGRIGVFRPGVPIDLHIVAKNARPIASNLLTVDLDADLRVTGTARRQIEIAGKIHVRRALIGIPNALPPDVAVLQVRRPGEQPAATAKPIVVGLGLDIDAPRQVLVRGRGLDAELGGDLRLSGTVDAPIVAGGFDLQRGRFDLAGTKLSFTQGRVGFNGAGLRGRIDPSLDFTARSDAGAIQTTLRITGLADAPRFELSSVPPMPPDQILSALLFGGTNPAQISALQAAQIGAALASLSGVGGESLNPLTKLQRALGLDRLTVGSTPTTTAAGYANGARSGASIAAGRYISSRVYVEAKQTTTGSSQLQVNVDLTRHLKLQTRIGNGTTIAPGTTPENDPGNSIGLAYQFEYP
ncbi:MAG TPA: translocation/assembly module TamB domain-containing protein, partial [Steroidobacteraceae bacterium]|nr:translocation/assembly module TamB domain-containing protein [Steroidobacteraceae bacterium]